jgi:hypothetical protein
MRPHYLFLFVFVLLLSACQRDKHNYKAVVPSPGFDVHLYFNLFNGSPFYLVYYKDTKIMNWSRLGFDPAIDATGDQRMVFGGGNGDAAIGKDCGDGGASFFKDLKYNERSVCLSYEQDTGLAYTIDFRAFNGGVAFRYRFDTESAKRALLRNERTEFNLNDKDISWEVRAQADTTRQQQDGYPLPVELMSDRYHTIAISEYATPDTQALRVRQQADSSMAFTLLNSALDMEGGGMTGQLSTSWRIMFISNSKNNE